MADKSYTTKNLLDNGYTTTHSDGSKSYAHPNLMDNGITVSHPDGTKSTIRKNLSDDGYTIYHADGSKSYAVKNLTDDNYTIHHPDGSKTYTTKELLSNGYTSYHTDGLTPAAPKESQPAKAAPASGRKPEKVHYKEYVHNEYPEASELLPYIPKTVDYTQQEAEAYAGYAASLLLKNSTADFMFLTEKQTITRTTRTGLLGIRKKTQTVSVERPVTKGIQIRDVHENYIGQDNSVQNEGHSYRTFLTFDGRIRYEHHTETEYYDGRSKDEYDNWDGSITNTEHSQDNRQSFNHIASLDYLLQKKNIQMSFDTFLQSGGEKAHPADQKLIEKARNELEKEKKRREAEEKKAEYPGKKDLLFYLSVFVLVIAAFVAVNLDQNDNKYFLGFFLGMGLICVFIMERQYTFKNTETSVMIVSLVEAGLLTALLKYTFTNMHYAWLAVPAMILIFILAAVSRFQGKRR